jgi:FtsH-binding integral membrane protein
MNGSTPPPPAGYPSPYNTNTSGYDYPQRQAYGVQQPGYGYNASYGQTYADPVHSYNAEKPPPPQGFDVEAQHAAQAASQFADVKIRSAFVRKVFVLVFLQLAATVGVAACFLFIDPLREYVAGKTVPCSASIGGSPTYVKDDGTCYQYGDGRWLFYTSWALSLVSLVALMCSTTLRRRVPWNYFAMAWFTIVMSVQVGCIVAYWNLSVVLIAFAVTGGAVIGVTLGAVFIPWDFTSKGNVLGMISLVVLFTALITFLVGFFYVSKWWYLTLSAIIALLFAAWLWYDIQLVVGKGKHKADPDEYVFSAVQIYLDVVIMFLNILNVVGLAS